jgi:hypothetical protein
MICFISDFNLIARKFFCLLLSLAPIKQGANGDLLPFLIRENLRFSARLAEFQPKVPTIQDEHIGFDVPGFAEGALICHA